MATFALTVTLGNDAMLTGHDVADALDRVATRLHDYVGADAPTGGESGIIRDANGATVGRWEVAE